jgi:hypothetical protein
MNLNNMQEAIESIFGTSIFIIEKWKRQRNGIRVLLEKHVARNYYTIEGAKHMLDVCFHGETQISPWYVVLSSSNTTAARTMTYAVPVFTEFNADYTEATRPEYVEAAAANTATTAYTTNTASKAEFTCNDTGTVYGAGLVGGGTGADTKGDVAGGGKLFNFSKFTGIAYDATTILAVTVQIKLTF